MSKIERVHVIFKTHLDIGFTHLAANVARQYREEFIPQALELAERMENSPGPERFVWTVGSWLIHHYLEHADEPQRLRMEQAIQKGLIAWHALPFTTHTELIDARLLSFGLSLSHRLDKRYGKTTIAAKMTDVPGHTVAMVRPLQEGGVRYLHIGVNPASKKPAVPKLFRWVSPDGAEIIVNYAGTYGEVLEMDGLKDALVFAHTGDNCGPPSEEEICGQFRELRQRFPGAEVVASTLDAFAAALESVREQLPIVTEEIGDTWIHGAATDPRKLAGYRELLRLRSKWLGEGSIGENDADYRAMSEALMLVAEHTWGLDLKKWLPDFRSYAKQDFHAARARNEIDATDIPAKYGYIGAFALDEFDKQSSALFSKEASRRSYSMLESSWAEQRAYVEQAALKLRPDKQLEALQALAELTPQKTGLSGSAHLQARTPYRSGAFELAFSERGALIALTDGCGKNWTNEQHPLGEFVYETFGTENYAHYFRTYMENLPATHPWADADFGKPGFEQVRPLPGHKLYYPVLDALEHQPMAASDRYVLRLRMPEEATGLYGAPKELEIVYDIPHSANKLEVTLQWFGKDANRLPEASWFACGLAVDNPNLWTMSKLGRAVSPLQVVKDGNRNLHAIDEGVYYQGADGRAAIESLDAALVAPGAKRLLQFDNTFASLEQGWHFNLHNNIWGTNFPMWYGEDAKFRFRIQLESHPKQ
ncbi:DUF5054 domain-containing protein [Paenibacillus macerans]|uniref:DUF5054 domain-containing protein n=1 Tax=Paenibacillus macerans TaxID=44252 RepID=UPI003D311D04